MRKLIEKLKAAFKGGKKEEEEKGKKKDQEEVRKRLKHLGYW